MALRWAPNPEIEVRFLVPMPILMEFNHGKSCKL